jgi:hypothetical protein
MKFKGTVIWAGVLVALAAFVYFYEIKGGHQREQAAQEARKIVVTDADQVTGVALSNSQGSIHCQLTEDGWQITDPITAAGDETVIGGIIGALLQAETERVISETGGDLAQYGLDPPQVTLELTIQDAPPQILHLGRRNPAGSQVYVRKESESKVFLTQSSLLSQAEKNSFDLRDKRVLVFQEPEVKELKLVRGQKTLEVRKTSQGWLLEKPLQVNADNTLINSMINKLYGSLIQAFVEENPTDLSVYGIRDPELTVVLTLDPDRSQKTLHFGKREDEERYARDDSRDPVFLVPESLFEELNRNLFELRDKRLLAFDRNLVTKLELKYAQNSILCQKDTTGQWQMAVPESAAVDGWEIDNILSALTSLEADSFADEHPLDLSAYGLSTPFLQARISRGEEELARLLIGKSKGQQVYACNAGGAPVALVDGAILQTLTPAAEDLMKKETTIQ